MCIDLYRVDIQRFADGDGTASVGGSESSAVGDIVISSPNAQTGAEGGNVLTGNYSERHKARQARMADLRARIESRDTDTHALDTKSGNAQDYSDAANGNADTTEDTELPKISFADKMRSLKAENPSEFQAYFDAQFGNRHKDYKSMQETTSKRQPIYDLLKAQYGSDDPDTILVGLKRSAKMSAQWQELADCEGMTTDQYLDKVLADAEMDRIKAENDQLRASMDQRAASEDVERRVSELASEADLLKEKYPGFDLSKELESKDFQRYLKMGNSVEDSFLLTHHDTIANIAAQEAEKKVIDNIRARGSRPTESGMRSGRNSVDQPRQDPAKMTRQERRRLAERAMQGETVKF